MYEKCLLAVCKRTSHLVMSAYSAQVSVYMHLYPVIFSTEAKHSYYVKSRKMVHDDILVHIAFMLKQVHAVIPKFRFCSNLQSVYIFENFVGSSILSMFSSVCFVNYYYSNNYVFEVHSVINYLNQTSTERISRT
jgi:hypothetical protein